VVWIDYSENLQHWSCCCYLNPYYVNLPLTAPTLYVCANLATEKKMLKNELHEAQVV
jgi:hypothetical protein